MIDVRRGRIGLLSGVGAAVFAATFATASTAFGTPSLPFGGHGVWHGPSAEVSMGALPAANGQLVVNGTFDSAATRPWESHAAAAIKVEGGKLRIDVTGGTTNFWDSMIGQKAIPLRQGTAYTLSFDASATAATTMRTTVQLGKEPYAPFTVEQTVALTTQTQHFSFSATGALTTAEGEVTFQIGGSAPGSAVFLDNVSLTVAGAAPSTPPSAPPSPTAPPSPSAPPAQPGTGPFAKTGGLYVEPGANPAAWVAANGGDPRAGAIRTAIASKPIAKWFGNWSGDIGDAVGGYVRAAAAGNKLPMLVAYNIPGRDCGGASGGGAGSPAAYRDWISEFAGAIGNTPAVVVIEPDALAQVDCAGSVERIALLRYATEQLRAKAPNTWAYLDAGNARWVDAGTMASRLTDAGVANVRGIAVNVSNYYTTVESVTYAQAIRTALGGGIGYVVDTSRNGNGGTGEWCNPPGRKLGAAPKVDVDGADALLWIKVPGDSDGPCGIGGSVPAGQFSPDLAMALING